MLEIAAFSQKAHAASITPNGGPEIPRAFREIAKRKKLFSE
jgi:hypothetical protein